MVSEKKNYIYFQRDVTFLGKHARYIDEMWTQGNGVIEEKDLFNNLYELYIMAAIVGLRSGRKAGIDNSEDDKRTIQAGQIFGQSEKLNEIMKLILLIDDSDGLSNEDKVNRAFRGPKNDDEFNHHIDLFNSYARGGIELLYEELKLRVLDLDDKYTETRIGNIVALLQNEFKEML